MWLVFVGLYNIYSNISDQMSGVEKWMATNQETVAYCRLFDTVLQLHERGLLCVKIWPVLKIWHYFWHYDVRLKFKTVGQFYLSHWKYELKLN